VNVKTHRNPPLTGASRALAGAASLAVLVGLSGCVLPNSSAEPSGPPAAWVQRSNPINPAPLEFEHRLAAVPPIPELQSSTLPSLPTTPALELPAPMELGPEVPAPLPANPAEFPPLAPGAETTPPTDLPPPAMPEPAVTQAMLDDLSAQISALSSRVEQQATELSQARSQAEAAKLATQRLQSEFVTWRAELDIVRETIQIQSAADVQALDELNQTLEQLLAPETPVPPSHDAESPHTANGRTRRGVAR
jgi:hypothetical protein